MSRTVPLSELDQGISRLRVKGGADPKSLYDLVNAHLTPAGTVESRHGTSADATLPAGTVGLMTFDAAFVVFSHEVVGSMPSGYTCKVLAHPDDSTQTLVSVHFAQPFMGQPYVVGEFANGDTYHYWLQEGDTWTADTVYDEGEIVMPSTSNGMAYRALRLIPPYPAWEAKVKRTVGDKIEPSSANGYYYEVTASDGRSGEVEPTWPTEDGATVTEKADLTNVVTTTPIDPGTGVDGTIADRYDTGSGDTIGPGADAEP